MSGATDVLIPQQERDFVCTGTLLQFRGIMEKKTARIARLSFPIYGPIQNGVSLTWWVGNGPNMFLEYQQQGKARMVASDGVLHLDSGMTLEQIVMSAKRINWVRLLKLLNVAEVTATEVPRGLVVHFASGGIGFDDLFWRWADGLLKILHELGFQDSDKNAKSAEQHAPKRPNPKRNRGKTTEYPHEVMFPIVLKWWQIDEGRLRTVSDGEDLSDDDVWNDEPARRITKAEFLANEFSNGDLSRTKVSVRRFDQWMNNYRTGKWKPPKGQRLPRGKRK